MTSSEWVRFCTIYTAHHLAVVRSIIIMSFQTHGSSLGRLGPNGPRRCETHSALCLARSNASSSVSGHERLIRRRDRRRVSLGRLRRVTWVVRDLEPADDVLPGSAERSHDRLVADRALRLAKRPVTIIAVGHGWWLGDEALEFLEPVEHQDRLVRPRAFAAGIARGDHQEVTAVE